MEDGASDSHQVSKHAASAVEPQPQGMIVCALFILKRERKNKGSQGGESVETSQGEEIVEAVQRCIKSTFYFEASCPYLTEELEKLEKDKILDKIADDDDDMPDDDDDDAVLV